MLSWLGAAILSAATLGLINIIDSHLLSKRMPSLGSYLVPVGIANLIGGLIFFWVDKFIFQSASLDAEWQIKEQVVCYDCGTEARGYRLVKDKDYDRSDSDPQFRCETCSSGKENKRKD